MSYFKAVFIMLFLILSCKSKPEFLSKENLVEYLNEPSNGLVKFLTKENMEVKVIYSPKSILFFQDNYQADSNQKKYLDSIDYFALNLSRDKKEIDSFESNDLSNTQYFNSQITEDVYLLSSGDTINVFDVIHAPTYGAAGSTRVMFAFKSNLIKQIGEVSFVFDDSRFGSGYNEFVFDTEDIKRIPALQNVTNP